MTQEYYEDAMTTLKTLDEYVDTGSYLAERLFSDEELACIIEEIEGRGAFKPAAVVAERDGPATRSLYGGFESSAVMQQLVADERVLRPVMQLLHGDVHVYQFKVNMKHAFGGDVWPWHQDFAFWNRLDGMPRPDAITAVLLLDDVTEFNAPMFCLPGSHRAGLYPVEPCAPAATRDQASDHAMDVSSTLRFTLARDTVAALAASAGIRSVQAPRGSVFFFHPNLVHASTVNISPHDRRQMLITYNSVRNALPRKTTRPGYLVNSSTEAIAPRRGMLSRARRTVAG